MDFMEFHRYEIDAAVYVSPWERWAARVEKIIGHDLDGDQESDGYSLDFALEVFEEGTSAEVYAQRLLEKSNRNPQPART